MDREITTYKDHELVQLEKAVKAERARRAKDRSEAFESNCRFVSAGLFDGASPCDVCTGVLTRLEHTLCGDHAQTIIHVLQGVY